MYGKTDEELTKSKLYILLLLQKIDEPFSDLNITQVFVETELIEYFPLQQYLFELESSSFIEKKVVERKNYYQITERGKSALKYFKSIMLGIDINKLEDYLSSNLLKFYRYKEIRNEYKKISDGHIEVSLQLIHKDQPFITLTADVPTIETAKKICSNWDSNASEIYNEVMSALTKNRITE